MEFPQAWMNTAFTLVSFFGGLLAIGLGVFMITG